MSPLTLDTALRNMNRHQEEQEASNLASKLGLTYTLLDDYPFNLDVLSIIPFDICEEFRVASYLKAVNKLKLAIVHPEKKEVLDFLHGFKDRWSGELELTVISETGFRGLLLKYAQLIKEKQDSDDAKKQKLDETEKKNYFHKIKNIDDLKNEIDKLSTTDMLDAMMAAAYNQGASDIHIEPSEKDIVVRLRIDGVLKPVITIKTEHLHAIISRLRMMGDMHLDKDNATQDGRFSLLEKGINADVRISIIPTGYGEGVVMRILRQDMQVLTIAELGFTEFNQELITKAMHKPYGLILVTGPTGSGKTTTLYSILRELNSPEKKIITLEDPIEYHIAGIQQSQVDPERGFTFADGLRGALRQDPDIVMLGEIRDAESATIALNASLSGHLVLSTLHTNNAVSVHTRLLEMGIAPFLISGSIQAIIAQRLVRKLKPGSDPENPEFEGRIIVSEVLVPNQEFEKEVLAKADQQTLEEYALKAGMIPMTEDGMTKVKAGLTTEEELSRVTEV